MFQRPPRPRARHGARVGLEAQASGEHRRRDFAFPAGPSRQPGHSRPTTGFPCRHTRSTDSPTIRGSTRPARRPRHGRRAAVGRRAATVAARTAWGFREGALRERVAPSGSGSDTVAPPAHWSGGAICVWGTRSTGGDQRRWIRRTTEGWPAGARLRARGHATPGAGAGRSAAPPHTRHHSRGRSSGVERCSFPTTRPGHRAEGGRLSTPD